MNVFSYEDSRIGQLLRATDHKAVDTEKRRALQAGLSKTKKK